MPLLRAAGKPMSSITDATVLIGTQTEHGMYIYHLSFEDLQNLSSAIGHGVLLFTLDLLGIVVGATPSGIAAILIFPV